MPVFDPFSAASKPMPDWDSIPSKPLPFAATLHALDINAMPSGGHSQRLPRPLREDEFLKAFPTPAYAHARHGSIPAAPPSPSVQVASVGSDQWWKQKVAHCVDFAKGDLVISDCGLETLSPRIIDLRDLVTLSQVRSPTASPSNVRPSAAGSPRSPFVDAAASPRYNGSVAFGDRAFSRTQSAPASAAFFSSLHEADIPATAGRGSLLPPPDIPAARPLRPSQGSDVKRFTRSKTGATHFTRSAPNVGIYAQHNRLYTLPTALFEIRNLTVLSLRRNNLTSLPAAIGELINLKELNISSNQITHLPSTILNLTCLEQFGAHPNPWRQPPAPVESDEAESSYPAGVSRRVLSTLVTHVPANVPRLTSLCLSVLLSPRLPSYQAPFTKYDWNECIVGSKHPLLVPEVLQSLMPPCFTRADLVRVQQAVRSAASEAPKGRSYAPSDGFNFPATHDMPEPDDAAANPFYYPCPSPRHTEWSVDSDANRPTRRIFLHAAEERVEWVEISKAKNIPIQWLGCSPGCLAFLDDEEEEDDWPFDESDCGTFAWAAPAG